MVGIEHAGTACIAAFMVMAVAACGAASNSGTAASNSSAASPTASNQGTAPTPTATGAVTTTTFPELEGTWALTFTVTGYKGPPSGGKVAYPLGSVQKLAWNFNTTCVAQLCQAFGEASPVPIPGESSSFSPTGAFTLTDMAMVPLVSTAGSAYTGHYPGTFGCGTEDVSLTVTATTARPDGPHATALTGTDDPVGDGSCPGVEYVIMKVTGTQLADAAAQGS